jgi:hypothetical protein
VHSKVDVIKSVRVEGIRNKALIPFLFFVMPQNFQEDCQGKREESVPVHSTWHESIQTTAIDVALL